MCSAKQVVLFLAATWVSSTVALAPCCPVIIENLSVYPECYRDGKPPNITTGGGGEATYLVYTRKDIPAGVKCLTGSQDDLHTYGEQHYLNGTKTSNIWNTVVYPTYIEESKDGSDSKLRLYVIRNEMGAYAYYLCISEGSDKGTGTHAVHVAVGCDYTTDNKTLAVVEESKKCFNKLRIKYVDTEPCEC